LSQQEPSEEELRAALEEQMRHVQVEDVLAQTVVTLINLGARRLGLTGDDEPQPDQARLAIDGARALMPLLPDAEELGPVRDALSQLQMAFVQRSGGAEPAEGAGPQAADRRPQETGAEPDREAEDRAKARSKLWTPPGT
jgi:hypothetical protein